MKKIISLVVIVMLLNMFCPLLVYAETRSSNSDFSYWNVEGGIEIYKYNGTDTSITIPNEIDGKKVVAFTLNGNDNVKHVKLSNTKIVNHNCLAGCTSLESVEIPNTVEIIEYGSFFGCTSLKEIKLPSNLKEIGNGAFQNCSNLKSITIPDSVTTIERECFVDCTALEQVKLPNKLKTIEYNTFGNCTSLKNIIIPESVTQIKSDAFEYCESLVEISIPKNVKELEGDTFYHCKALSHVELPEGLTAMSRFEFADTNLTSIYIPKSVTKMDTSAFDYTVEWINDNYYIINYNVTIHGYSDSYAKQIAEQYNIPFVAIDVSSNIQVDKNEYILAITDNSKNRITDKKVSVNGVECRLQNGLVKFDKSQYNIGQLLPIKIKINNKEYTLYHELQKTGKGFITIPKNQYDLVSAFANGHEILTTTKIINLASVSNVEIKLRTANTQDMVQYKIYQGNKLLATANGKGEAQFTIASSDINIGSNIKVEICDASGKILASKVLSLKLIRVASAKNLSLGIGDDIKLTLPEELGVLAGAQIKIPLKKCLKNAEGNLPILYESDGEKIKIGITTENLKLDEDEFEKSVKRIFSKKKDKYTEKDTVELKFTAYNEMTFNNGVFTENKSFGALSLCFKSSGKFNTVVVVPIAFKLEASVEGIFDIGLKYDVEKAKVDFTSDIKLKGAFQVNVGIGGQLASAGVYGNIEDVLQINLAPKIMFKQFELSGKAGVYVEVFGFEVTYPILKGKATADQYLNWTVELKNAFDKRSIYNIRAYGKVSKRSADATVNWNTSQNNKAEKNLLVDKAYTYTNQQIVSNSNNTLMLFIDDDSSRDDNNFKTLKYSIYNKQTKTWGKPVKLDENNTQDNSFKAYTNGTDIYVAYAEEKEQISANSQQEEYAIKQEISVAKWNSTSKKFEQITRLTNNDTYDFMPEIAVIDNVPTAIWVNNKSNNPFGTTTDNTVLYSKFENNSWSSPKTLSSNNNSITELRVGKIGNNSYVTVITDNDNDLSTETDRNIKIIDFSGNEKSISVGSNANIDIVSYKGNNILTWYSDGIVNTLTDVNGNKGTLFNEEIAINSNNKIAKNGDKLVVFYVAQTGHGNALYQIIQDANGNFGEPIIVFETQKAITCYDAIFQNGELLLSYTETYVDTQNENYLKTSQLYSMRIQDKFDIEVVDVEYNVDEFNIGSTTNMTVYVRNNMQVIPSTVNITVTNEYGSSRYYNNVKRTILPGATEKFELNDIEIDYTDKYTVTVQSLSYTDINKENNSKTFNIEYSDISVSANQVNNASGDYAVVYVENKGNFDAQNVKLNIMKGNEIIGIQEFDKIEAHSSDVSWIYLKDEYYKDNSEIVTFKVTTDTNELCDSNNEYTLSVIRQNKNGTTQKSELPFTDVKDKDWYYNSVKYVYENKMILGKTDTLFKPSDKLTRGQLVTILWRMEGSKKVSGTTYSDVKSDQYYYEAVKWASKNKIVNGYKEGKFKPNNNITREQLAVILKNYAVYKKKNVSSNTDLTKYKDYKYISDYAVEPIKWAISKKIISGKENGTKADPRGTASRAEAAAMIANYCIYVGR